MWPERLLAWIAESPWNEAITRESTVDLIVMQITICIGIVIEVKVS